MYLGGRWIPLELANTIFILWGLAVIILAAVVFWLSRRRPPIDRKRRGPRRRSAKGRSWRSRR